jgi:hypothetical protein
MSSEVFIHGEPDCPASSVCVVRMALRMMLGVRGWWPEKGWLCVTVPGVHWS